MILLWSTVGLLSCRYASQENEEKIKWEVIGEYKIFVEAGFRSIKAK